MYVAEELVNAKTRYLYQGNFGEFTRAIRPVIILYDIEKLKFHVIKQIPVSLTPGQISWRPDSRGIIGVVWSNHPFPMGCPGCANRASQVHYKIYNDENLFMS